MRRGGGPAVFVALALGAAAGCQLIAGTGDLKAHGGSRAAGGGGASNTGPGSGSVGGSGGSGAAGGAGGAGGHACEAVKDGPACGFVTEFGKVASTIQPTALAASAGGASYLAGSATGANAFGLCKNGGSCGFIQAIDAAGARGKKVVFGTGGVGVSDVVELGQIGGNEVVLAGTLSSSGHLGLSTDVTLSGKSQPVYVAAYGAGLTPALWARGLLLNAAGDQDDKARIRIGATGDGQIIAAANVAASDGYAFGDCSSVAATNAEDIAVVSFDPAGSCASIASFGGTDDQTVDVLRVSPGGGFVLAGGYRTQITFPMSVLSAGFIQVGAYYAYFAKGQAQETWARALVSDHDVQIHGAGISKGEGRLAVAGSFVGAVPIGLDGVAAVKSCPPRDGMDRRGFVQTIDDVGSGAPDAALQICLGESGDTRIDDVTIDDMGGVMVVGQTTGTVKYKAFEMAAHGGDTAAFALKIDGAGKVVWGTGPEAAPNAVPFRAVSVDGGSLVAGLFAGEIAFACGCGATAVTQGDAFLSRLGP